MQENRFHWKQFLTLGEELLCQTHSNAQCLLIERTVAEHLGCPVKVWLAEPFYPLPGEVPPPLVSQASSPPVVRYSCDHHKPACLLKNRAKVQPFSPPMKPYSIAFPLLTQGNLLGVLLAEKETGQEFKEDEIDYLERVAAHAALALQVTRQAILKNWRHEQINLVRSVSAQITKVLDLEQLFQHATRLIQESFGYYFVAIFTLGDEPITLDLRAYASSSKEVQLPEDYSVEVGAGIVGFVAQNDEVLIVKDTGKDDRYLAVHQLPQTQAEAALPLKIEGKLLGVLDVQSTRRDAFHETDMLVLRSLADNIAMAIEEAYIYTDLERRADQISAILEVSHKLNSILELDSLLQEIVQVIHKRFGYPLVQIYTVHTNRRLVIYQTSNDPSHTNLRENYLAYPLDDPVGIIPWVARNNQPWISNDITVDPLYRPSGLLSSGTRSELAVPLSYAGNVAGVLDIQSNLANAFTQHDLTLLNGLAAGIAIAVRNASLYKTEQWRRQVADSLNEIAGLINANTALDTLLDSILNEVDRNLPCEVTAIWLFDDAGIDPDLGIRPLRLAALHGADPELIQETWRQKPEIRKWLDTVVTFKEPGNRRSGDIIGPLGTALKYPEDYSAIAAPLKSGDLALGVLELAHPNPNLYGSDALSLVSTFASYAAVAIQSARLYSEAQEQAWISNVLLQVTEASQSAGTIDDLFAAMVRLVPLLVGIKKCAFFLWDDQQATFELKESHGIEFPDAPLLFTETEHPSFGRLRNTLKMVYMVDSARELHLPAEIPLPTGETFILLPLLVRGELVGAFLVVHQVTGQPGAEIFLTDRTLTILQGIAHQIAVAYDNLRLTEHSQQESYIAAAMLQVAQAISTQNNLEDILYATVNLMPILVGINACVIYLWDSAASRFKPAGVYSISKSEKETILQHPLASGEALLVDRAFEQNQPHFCLLPEPAISLSQWDTLNCQPADRIFPTQPAPSGGWLMAFPLASQGEKFGVLLTREIGAPIKFQSRRVEIISGIAQQISLAIENETLKTKMLERERIEREFQLARQIQLTFLPSQLPEIPGWDFNIRWQTAREVGGDFYDIFSMDGCHTALVVADVSDKGMPAALYMTVTRTLIRAFANARLSPASVLKKVNELLLGNSQGGMFVTATYAVLCTEDGSLTYANAGHNRPILLRSSKNQLEVLPKGDLAMGVLEDVQYQDYQFILEPNDTLFMYTDGVTDTFSPSGETFGDERLHKALLQVNHENSQNLLNELDQILSGFRENNPVSDDLTILCVHRRPTFQNIPPGKRLAAKK